MTVCTRRDGSVRDRGSEPHELADLNAEGTGEMPGIRKSSVRKAAGTDALGTTLVRFSS
jgi:hypothetical protein